MANDITLKSKTGVKKYPKTYSRNIIDKETTPTSQSTNLITSGAVYTALQGKQDALPTTTTAGQVLKSTSTAGTVEWGTAGSSVTVSSTGVTDGTNTYNASDKVTKAVPTAEQGSKEFLYTFAGTTQNTDVALINDMSSGVASYTDKMVPTALSVKEELDKKAELPTITNDRYLHTNSSTGALEWSTVSGGGSVTDVQVNGTTVVSNNIANVVTNTAYDASTNKIATMSDLPSGEVNLTLTSTSISDGTTTMTLPTVDQSYSASSTNAQSGVAVAAAIGSLVTTNTAQTITGAKTFSAATEFDGAVDIQAQVTCSEDITVGGENVAVYSGDDIIYKVSDGEGSYTNYTLSYPTQTGTIATTADLANIQGTAIKSTNATSGQVLTSNGSGGSTWNAIPSDSSKLDATKCTYQTTAPTASISDGGVHIVHLSSSTGVTEYNGYIYMYDEE